jgi:hypothetical protein
VKDEQVHTTCRQHGDIIRAPTKNLTTRAAELSPNAAQIRSEFRQVPDLRSDVDLMGASVECVQPACVGEIERSQISGTTDTDRPERFS